MVSHAVGRGKVESSFWLDLLLIGYILPRMIISASDRHAVSPGLPTQQKLKFILTREYLPQILSVAPGCKRFGRSTDGIHGRNPEFKKLRTLRNVYFFNMGQISNLCFRSAWISTYKNTFILLMNNWSWNN